MFDFSNIKEDRRVNLVDHINQKKMQIRFLDCEDTNEESIQLELRRPYGYSRLYEYPHHYDLNIAANVFEQGS